MSVARQRLGAFHVDAANPEDLAGGDGEGDGEAAGRGVAAIADRRLPVALLVEELVDPAQRVLEQVLVDGRLARHRHQLGSPRLGDRIAFEAQRDERSRHDRDGRRRRADRRPVTCRPASAGRAPTPRSGHRAAAACAPRRAASRCPARRRSRRSSRRARCGCAATGPRPSIDTLPTRARRPAATSKRSVERPLAIGLERRRDAGLDEAAGRQLRRQHLGGRIGAAGAPAARRSDRRRSGAARRRRGRDRRGTPAR